jgi:hypothetical protein
VRGLGQLVGLSLVVMGLSQTIARERVFEPLRGLVARRSDWFGYLVSCPYCVSHWVALALVPVTGVHPLDVTPRLGSAAPVVRWFLASILVATLAAFLRVVFYFVDETQGLVRRRQKVVERQVAPPDPRTSR